MTSSVVLIAGGYRTGTTLAYMLTQRLLEAAGHDFAAIGASSSTMFETWRLTDPWVVVKAHDVEMAPGPGRFVVWCDRNPVDAVASYTRFVPLEEAVEKWRRARELRKFYAAGRADVLWLDYEWLYRRPHARASLIAAHLGLKVAADDRARIVEGLTALRVKALADGLRAADSWTELRPGHVGDELGRPNSAPADTRDAVAAALAERLE